MRFVFVQCLGPRSLSLPPAAGP